MRILHLILSCFTFLPFFGRFCTGFLFLKNGRLGGEILASFRALIV
jgi:hypothetical protein